MLTHVMIINQLTNEHTSQLPRATSLIPWIIHIVPQECVISLKKVSYIIIKEADYHEHTCDEFGTGIREIILPFQGDF